MSKHVLIIATSHHELGHTGRPTGVWAEELSTPYYALVDAGFDVTLASPKGGQTPWAQDSVKNEPSVQRFLSDPVAMAKFNAAQATSQMKAHDFEAIFLPGGHGVMWDTATDISTARLVADFFNANKPIAAVCHGSAGLIQAQRQDGQSILLGKKINSFTNEEETAAGLMDVVPFHLETKLRALGGLFEHGPTWAAFAVRDGNLITGQNPASSALVARHLMAALQD
jgi:putative intracellular protease/amidase